MPEKIKKVGKGKYQVSTPGGVKSKGTTKEKAEAQVRLLRGIEHNPDFKKQVRRRVMGK